MLPYNPEDSKELSPLESMGYSTLEDAVSFNRNQEIFFMALIVKT